MKDKDADYTVKKQYMSETDTEEEDDVSPTTTPTKKTRNTSISGIILNFFFHLHIF